MVRVHGLCLSLHVVLDFNRCKALLHPHLFHNLTLIDSPPPHSLQLDLANPAIRECGIAQYRQQSTHQHYLLLIDDWAERPAYPPYCRTNYLLWAHGIYQPIQIIQTLCFYFGNDNRVFCSVCGHGNCSDNHSEYKFRIFHSY